MGTVATSPTDPVRARRAVVTRWTTRASRLGYLLYGVACVAFVVGFTDGLTGGVVALVVGCLAVGSALLAPAIVLGYAIKAAERDDRERGY